MVKEIVYDFVLITALDWTMYSPPNSYAEGQTLTLLHMEMGSTWTQLRLKQIMRVGPWYVGSSFLIGGYIWELSVSTKWGHSEQAEAVSKEEAPPRTEYLAS